MSCEGRALRRPFLCVAAICIALMLLCAPRLQAQTPHRDLYMYKGADRDQRILQGAKKERQVVVYTSLNLKDSVPIAEAFEKKYGVKLTLWRSSSEKVLQRALTEARAGRYTVDAFELNGPEMEALYREGMLEEFHSPQFRNLPPQAFTKHRHYAADRFNFFTIAYNTNLVKPNEVPNSYEDLLHPRWVGRIGIEAGDTDWFGSIVKLMGEDRGLAFFRKLSQMKPQIRTGHTLMAELVASGEIPEATSSAIRVCPVRICGFICESLRKNASPLSSPMSLTIEPNQSVSPASMPILPTQRGCSRSSYEFGTSFGFTRLVL